MGGKGGDDKASRKAMRIADDIWDNVRPLNRDFTKQFRNFMSGGYDPMQNPVYQAGRNAMEDQFQVAQDQIIANMAPGGAMDAGLNDLYTGRARGIGELAAQVAQDEYNKAYGMATMSPQQSLSSLGQLAGQQAMSNAQQQAGKYGMMGDIGQGAGMLIGMSKGGPAGAAAGAALPYIPAL